MNLSLFTITCNRSRVSDYIWLHRGKIPVELSSLVWCKYRWWTEILIIYYIFIKRCNVWKNIYFAFKWKTRGNTLQQQFQNTIEISYKDAQIYTPNILSWIGTVTSITSGLLQLVLWAKIFWWHLCPPL